VPETGAPESSHEPVALRRVRLVVAYDGSAFRGFAANHGLTTVVKTLSEALSMVTRHPVTLVGAGRTDAGVHAWGQVVSCDLPAHVKLRNVVRRVNSLCGPELVIREADWASDDFSARFSAIWRHYRYTIVNSPAPNPFLHDLAWHIHRPLSLPAMQLACDPLIGENDFTSFCRKPKSSNGQEPSMHRRVMLARWTDVSDEMDAFSTDQRVLRFEIRANAFCHQMVRSIVGTMVDVGLAKCHAGDIRTIMRARDRKAAAVTLAPAHGLILWEVGYRQEDTPQG
jgi:tRNA pseudouridine38-40 synthase